MTLFKESFKNVGFYLAIITITITTENYRMDVWPVSEVNSTMICSFSPDEASISSWDFISTSGEVISKKEKTLFNLYQLNFSFISNTSIMNMCVYLLTKFITQHVTSVDGQKCKSLNSVEDIFLKDMNISNMMMIFLFRCINSDF